MTRVSAVNSAQPSRIVIVQAETVQHMAAARMLFTEYASSLGFSLCFQNFDRELADLPGDYAPSDGRLLLEYHGAELAGCVALHKLDDDICEMKRLYVRPEFRGQKLGAALVDAIIAEARAIGYKFMRLDTVEPLMADAVRMYRKLGFREIASYRSNPIAGALYMEKEL